MSSRTHCFLTIAPLAAICGLAVSVCIADPSPGRPPRDSAQLIREELEPDEVAILEEVPFASDRWHFDAAQSRVEEYLGRTSLYLREGIAWVEDVELTDGVLEFDIAFTDERGFMGVMWRLQDDGNYEHFYIRPHQSGNPDANQYTPVFDGLSSWQLYHGSGYGAAVEYPYDEWIRVRIVVAGRQAEVYINDMRKPILFIPDLKRSIHSGGIGISASYAPAHFSRFRYHAGQPPAFRTASPPARRPPEGAIPRWEVSDPFDWATLQDTTRLPPRVVEERSWRGLSTESSGLANLGKMNRREEGRDAVFARVTLDSVREQMVSVRFGYSDLVRVYLNGRVIYAGDNRYRSRDYRYLGTIGFFDEVFLPLRRGENQLLFAVAENFGGWGLQAVVQGGEGITVRP